MRKRKSVLRWLWGMEDDLGWRDFVIGTRVTWVLFVVTVLVSSLDELLPTGSDGVGNLTHLLGYSEARIASGEWWRLGTWTLLNVTIDARYGFLFSATGHLVTNMLGLVLVGPRLERRIGHIRLLALYVIAAVVAGATTIAVLPLTWSFDGGSSGSVYGLLGAILVVAFFDRRLSRRHRQYFAFASVTIVIIPGLLVSGLAVALAYRTTNISHGAGFVAGAVLALAWLLLEDRRHARRLGIAAAAALVFVSGVLVAPKAVTARQVDEAVLGEVSLDAAPALVTFAFDSLWVSTDGAGPLVRIDPRTRRRIATIRRPRVGGGLVAARGSLWVAGDGSVVEIDPGRNRAVASVRVPGEGPWGLAASREALWAALPDRGSVARMDLTTREVRETKVGERPFAVLAKEGHVWVTSYDSRTVSRIDARAGEVVESVALDASPYWMEVADGSLWVGAEHSVYRLDPRDLSLEAKIDAGQQVWAMVAGAPGELWISERFGFRVSRIDTRANEIVRRVHVGVRQPYGIDVSDNLWVADVYRQAVLEIDPRH